MRREHALRRRYGHARFPMPETEPNRPCGICSPRHDRGDGRCERHGRIILSMDAQGNVLGPLPHAKQAHGRRGHAMSIFDYVKASTKGMTREQKARVKAAIRRNMEMGEGIDIAVHRALAEVR